MSCMCSPSEQPCLVSEQTIPRAYFEMFFLWHFLSVFQIKQHCYFGTKLGVNKKTKKDRGTKTTFQSVNSWAHIYHLPSPWLVVFVFKAKDVQLLLSNLIYFEHSYWHSSCLNIPRRSSRVYVMLGFITTFQVATSLVFYFNNLPQAWQTGPILTQNISQLKILLIFSAEPKLLPLSPLA